MAGRIQVGKDHVRGVCVIADRGKHGFGDLALIRGARDAHLQEVKGLEPGALGLRLGEMVGVGERQAHIGRHVLEQPDVPIVEGAVVALSATALSVARSRERRLRLTPSGR